MASDRAHGPVAIGEAGTGAARACRAPEPIARPHARLQLRGCRRAVADARATRRDRAIGLHPLNCEAHRQSPVISFGAVASCRSRFPTNALAQAAGKHHICTRSLSKRVIARGPTVMVIRTHELFSPIAKAASVHSRFVNKRPEVRSGNKQILSGIDLQGRGPRVGGGGHGPGVQQRPEQRFRIVGDGCKR